MKILFCLLFVLLAGGNAIATQDPVSLEDALASGQVRIQAKGSGGYNGECLVVAVRNMGDRELTLSIEPGNLFSSKDSSVQDLIITAPAILVLKAGEVKHQKLFTMCTQSHNMSPSAGDDFAFAPKPKAGLIRLAQYIADQRYQTSTAQSAIWAVASGDPASHVYGMDTTEVRGLAEIVSDATGVPMSQFYLQPRPHHITSIRTSMEALIPKDLKAAALVLVDENGREYRRYFENRSLETGFLQFRVGVNHTEGDSAVFFLRLMEGEEVILEKPVAITDSVIPLRKVNSQAIVSFSVDTDTRADVGIYDTAGNMYFILGRNTLFQKGTHRSQFIGVKDLPADRAYVVKVVSGGKTIAEGVFDTDGPEPVIHPVRTVKGRLDFKLEEPLSGARLEVLDQNDDIIRVLFENGKLNPGNKNFNYTFQHHLGPEAAFRLRLTAGERVILEREIQ